MAMSEVLVLFVRLGRVGTVCVLIHLIARSLQIPLKPGARSTAKERQVLFQ